MENDNEHIVIITVHNRMPDDISTIVLRTALPGNEIIPAVKAACRDYLDSPKGAETWTFPRSKFGWQEFNIFVDNTFCQPHGFTKLVDSEYECIEDYYHRVLVE